MKIKNFNICIACCFLFRVFLMCLEGDGPAQASVTVVGGGGVGLVALPVPSLHEHTAESHH